MTTKKPKFKKAAVSVKTQKQSSIKVSLPEIDANNGVIVDSSGGGKKEMFATYRAIRKELASRKGEKYRIIWLVRSFLVYRLK